MARPDSRSALDATDPEVAYARAQIAELSAANYGAVDRDCDMVMKGGITSGVVYPLTICRLATRYRLRSIGGTSAGAIAAGVAAAAEHRRRTSTGDDASAGYRALAGLPDGISTQLESLFQARPDTRRLYRVLNAAIDPDRSGIRKTLAIVGRIVAGRIAWFVGGFALTVALVVPGLVVTEGFPVGWAGVGRIAIGLVLPSLLATVIGVAAAVAGFAVEAKRVLPTTGFALTDGATHATTPGLTDWLADRIDDIAGVDTSSACLTLGDLWGPDALAAWRAGNDADWVKAGPAWTARAARHLSLEVMTTDLTIRRPFRMPFATQEFMFAESEWSTLFPARVVASMAKPEFLTDHLHPDTGERLYRFPGAGSATNPELPGPDALPVIVMVRMSLSFPGLISAVPLYAVDFNGDQSVVRHWFSDGGVSSNFPLHFFDALLPTRPTFGVNLAPVHPAHPDTPVWRPRPTGGGTIPRAQPFQGIGGFVAALRDTMQNWADNKQITQRGYADRVVEIRLSADEGGMNLRMPATRVLKLVARGARAGESLLEFDWDAHRIIRYRSTTARLTDVLDQMRTAWRAEGGQLYPAHLAAYPAAGAPGGSYLGGAAWRAADQAATDALAAAIDAWSDAGWPAVQQGWPQPAPHIRGVPE
jgi:hypothetical protein